MPQQNFTIAQQNYTWIPFYEAFADELLKYKKNRPKLIKMINEAYTKMGLTMPVIMDENKNITDIDPFTIFAMFNRESVNDEYREVICKGIYHVFSFKNHNQKIKIPLEADFISAPKHNKKTWRFHSMNSSKIPNNCFDCLWDLFEKAIAYSKDPKHMKSELAKAFDEAYKLPLIVKNESLLIIALYLIRPYSFINLYTSPKYYEAHDSRYSRGVTYLDFCENVLHYLDKHYNCKFPDFSFYASQNDKNGWEICLLKEAFKNYSDDVFKLPLELAYENYVSNKLEDLFTKNGWTVSLQEKKIQLFSTAYMLIPDIVIRKGKRTILLDTKFISLMNNEEKYYNIDPRNMYQIYTYAKKYNTKNTWLLFPLNDEAKGIKPIPIDFCTNSDNVHVRVFCVDISDIDKSLNDLKALIK